MARITIRLTPELHAHLLLYARGRNREAPEISAIVREALEDYLGQATSQTQKPKPVRRQQSRDMKKGEAHGHSEN